MRRNKVELLIDILRITSTQRLKITHIMYKANIGNTTLKKDVKQLCDANLIEIFSKPKPLQKSMINRSKSGKAFYGATEKGRKVVESYDVLLSLLKEEGRKFV